MRTDADRHPLLLPTGQVRERSVAQRFEAEQVEHLLDAASHRAGRQADLLHRIGQLLLDGLGDESGGRVLADDSDDVGQVAGQVVAGVATLDEDPAGERPAREVRDESADGPQEGGLARAGRADDEAHLAFVTSRSTSTRTGRRAPG